MARVLIGGLTCLVTAVLFCGCRGAGQAPQRSHARSPMAAPKAGERANRVGEALAEQRRQAKPEADDGAEAKLAQAHAHYGAGVIHEMNEAPEAALNEYYLAALNDPANEPLLLEVTRRLMQRKQPEKALELLARATELPDASGTVYARLGLVYGQLGKTEQALTANRTAIKRSPQGLAGYQNLFVTLLQSGRKEEALKVLDDAAKQTAVGPDFLAGLGELYANYSLQVPSQKTNIQPRALAVVDRAEKVQTPDALLRLRLAETYNLLGASDKAAPIYLDLLKRLPDVPALREQLHTKLAAIYLRGSDRTNAIKQLEAIVLQDPVNSQAHYWLGYLYYGEKRPEDAADQFNQAIVLHPDFAEAYYHLALAQLSATKAGDALQTLEKVRAKFPHTFLLEFYSGLACGELKDYTAALGYFTAAEAVAKATEPKLLDKEFYFQLGACCERTGDFTRAEEYFQKCLALSPDWPDACNYLGYMWAERGVNLEKARELIEKAVKAEPENAAYLDSLAWVFYKLDQPQASLKPMLQAIELSPKPDPTLFDHLGDIYMALKQPAKAREAWGRALAVEPNDAIRKKLEGADRE